MKKTSLFFTLFALATTIFASDTLQINNWLVNTAQPILIPVFDTIETVKGETWDMEKLADFNFYNPKELETESWEEKKSDKNGVLKLKQTTKSDLSIQCLATHITTDRFTKVTIGCKSQSVFRAWLDGKEIFSNSNFAEEEKEATEKKKEVKMEQGKHLLIVQLINKKEITPEIEGFCTASDSLANISLSLSPTHFMTVDNIMNGVAVGSVSISPDGLYYTINFSEQSAPEGKNRKWKELREFGTNKLIERFDGGEIWSTDWKNNSHTFTYITKGAGKNELWTLDPQTGENQCVIADAEEISDYTWAPDGTYLIYYENEKSDKNKTGLKRFEDPNDHWTWYRSRSFLCKYDIESGLHSRLTAGNQSTNLHDISPDSKTILFSVSQVDYNERPFSRQKLFSMNLESHKTELIWDKQFGGSASYSPNGKELLVTGSPMLFGDIGNNVKDGKTPNDYDTQAYLYNLKSKKATAITLNFKPKIQSTHWSVDGEKIWFRVEQGTYNNIYSYNIKEKKFKEIKSGVDVVNRLSIAQNCSKAIFTGCSISSPYKAYSTDLNNNTNPIVIADPEAKEYENVEFGKTEDWNFKNDQGVTIHGRVYYPPNFDSSKKYPVIVYYYAGTSPTNRSFGGRYPKNLFAAKGYIVYNLQPSGATGYGQDFSAMHVNNWGKTVAKEIIEGTKQFCDSHPSADRTKIGCIGASYGGFMTMYLQTQTNIFASAISHAGISSISSYWGEGYWGYLYSATASANSYPWNNREMYIEQSPLFNADKIHTPLLLLHGNSDTNVPPGESRQLFTALKILKRPVELIEIDKQNHHIVDYKKRIVWQNTILAWFDKWLKDESEWWNDLYPERNL